MQCVQYRQWIQELTDGRLGAIRKAELERHLEDCTDCRTVARDVQAIHDAAASLEPLVPPDHVWLQLAGRLQQEGRVSLPPARPAGPARHAALLAIAAALVLAVGASIVFLLPELRSNRPSQPPIISTAPQPGSGTSDDAVQSVESEFRLAEQHYQNAIARLEQAARLDQAADQNAAIDPQTAATLQKSLQVIDQAIAESRSALRSEPQSMAALNSLFDALRRKVGLLQDTIALMNEMRKGNSAGAARIVDGVNKS
jgi:anti-sigma factor RsiW